MLELQRKAMLEDMGLRIFQPRFQLSGARVSVLLPPENLPVEPIPDHVVAPQTVSVGQVMADVAERSIVVDTDVVDTNRVDTDAAATLSDLSGLFGQKPVTRPATVDQQAVSGQKGVAGQKVMAVPARFRHRLVRVGEFLMLLDQPSLEWADAARCKAFFADVHFALTGKRPEYWQDAQFDWPPVRNFPHANDQAMAQEALHVFLQEHVQQPPCRWILLWGDAVSQSTLAVMAGAGETTFLLDIPVLVLDACQQYWQEPQKKRLLWQYLQVVKKSLAADA